MWSYWAATTAVAALFAVPGTALLLKVPHFTEDMVHLGYPAYFLAILGIGKLLGATTIVMPGLLRLKEWAYAGMVFDAIAAAVSRAAIGDDALKIVAPVAIAGLVFVSWALRPDQRKLPLTRLAQP